MILLCSLLFLQRLLRKQSQTIQARPMCLRSTAVNSGAIGESTDVDWFSITTNADGKLDVTIAVSNSTLFCGARYMTTTALLSFSPGVTLQEP